MAFCGMEGMFLSGIPIYEYCGMKNVKHTGIKGPQRQFLMLFNDRPSNCCTTFHKIYGQPQ